ncbi:MAG: EscU/YscU/HrcU family type III secretion system export apparatus switch protein [Limnobacter sp.]|uniref:EscU/YscU/HrcU family type III secretion system export apparatus switch protein n=1 Tax=Limnobacter TaxID=131079 RepID=UPI0022BB1700|nr:EscU/YscU/HrcU family type III secretion system export apparatus switch protein [Limnobacter sp.]MCZ8017133.1 EscU/YscU/HrcU family type III secretion system export apparatus switch protein [Limnobacter sp.]
MASSWCRRRPRLTSKLNPQQAVALAYLEHSGAPKVVAKGKGLIAEQIIQKAKDSGVFVHESRELVSLLMNVDLDQQIPPGLYQAIAELLAWVYQIENKEFKTEG